MTVTQMMYFQAICEHESVTQAARVLRVSQPALSNAIKDLENEFGINLFHRQSKRFILTKEGEYFLAKVSPFLEDFAELQRTMISLGDARNSIKLGVSPYASGVVIPMLLNGFRDVHPEINFEVREVPSRDIGKYLAGELLDVGIVNIGSISPSEYEIYEILRTETVFCVHPDDPLAQLEEIDFETIGDHPLIMSSPNPRNADGVVSTFRSLGMEPNIILETDQVYAIIENIKRGYAAGFLYKEMLKDQTGIVAIPIKGAKPVTVGLIARKHNRIYNDTAKFIQYIKDCTEKGTLFHDSDKN